MDVGSPVAPGRRGVIFKRALLPVLQSACALSVHAQAHTNNFGE